MGRVERRGWGCGTGLSCIMLILCEVLGSGRGMGWVWLYVGGTEYGGNEIWALGGLG